MVVVAHDIQSGMRIADRLVILKDDEIIEADEPERVKKSDNSYVQQFLQRKPNKPQEKTPLFYREE